MIENKERSELQNTIGVIGTRSEYLRNSLARESLRETPRDAERTSTVSNRAASTTSSASAANRIVNAGGGIFTVPDIAKLEPDDIEHASSSKEFSRNMFSPQRIAAVSPRDVSFYPLQEWEGYVIEVKKETFTARLIDITAKDTFEQESAEFAKSDLTDDDLELLRPGAIFRWLIGYARSKGGTKKSVSDIVFRRMPMMTKAEIEKSIERANEISKRIVWE